MMKKLLHQVLFLLMFPCFASMAQTEVTGKITSAPNGEPLVGVSVLIKGTTEGASSNNDGAFRITVPNNSSVLVFKMLGFTTQEITVSGRNVINIALVEDQSVLEDVVVTAMGIERSSRSLGYAAQKVDNESLNQNKQSNIVNSMQGKIAGVSINSTGGAPGQGANIQIRGINSIDPGRNNQPLFVIDGVLMDNSTSNFGDGANLRGMSNRAADINPEDIESVNVLKGGAATALYGLRGANGVIVMTTKRGKAGTIKVNLSSTYGVENVNKYPTLQDKYSIGWHGKYDPTGFWPSFGPTVEEARKIDPTHPAQLYNHIKDAFETGDQFKNNLSISGGSEKITFLSSFSQLKQNGVLPFTDYKNNQARLNTNFKISEKLSAGASLNYTNSGGYRYNADRFNEQLIYWSPRWNIRDYVKEDGTMQTYGTTDNPIYIASTNRMKDNVDRFIGSFNFAYQPLSWLDFNYRAGIDTYADNRISTAPGPKGVVGEIEASDNEKGFIFDYNTRFRTINSTFIASGKHSFDNGINGTIRLGHELYDRQIRNTGVEGSELTVYDWFNLTNANVLKSRQNESKYRLMGVFGELSLDYKNYLFLTLTGRNDITSSLLSPNNSFFYPSASVSYVFTENLTLPSSITEGKVRFSYAEIGKDANEYSTSSGFASYDGLPTGYTGFTRPSLLGDPNLKPEFTQTYETGLDMSFLNSRVGFDFTYYSSTSKDQIISVPVSSTTGYVRAAVNAGTMRNRGVEFTVYATPIKKDGFSWQTQLNFSANRNKILKIREDLNQIIVASQSGYDGATVTMKLLEGQPYGTLFGRVMKRYYTPEEIAAKVENPMILDADRPVVIGANGFPVREPTSVQKILGNVQPKWIGGWSNTFTYRDLSLSTLVDARIGQYRYNQMANFYSAFGMSKFTENRNDYKVFEGVLADGTPNTQEVWLGQGIDPKTGRNYGDGYYRANYRGISEYFVEDASWVRLRSVSLSYNLPATWLSGSFVKNASITATGNNLWLWTKFDGYDPESNSHSSGSNIEGFAGFTYPAVRSFLFTLNVGF